MGGQWRRTPLAVPDVPGLRPTPGRVRETLFNWLGQDMTGLRCLDAFAGSGALGLEAASRGAGQVLLVEKDALLVANLRKVVTRLLAGGAGPAGQRVQVDRADALAVLAVQAGQGWDVVFLDPPFLQGQNEDVFAAALRAARAAIHTQGWVYLEAPRTWTPEELAGLGLVLHRQGKAGAVHFALLKPLS